jgi:formylglycine-generating enzyme required for sulfatase activity
MDLHKETTEDLVALFSTTPPSSFLRYAVAPRAGHFNQGNKTIAHHTIGKRACLDALRGITIQTEEQRARCGAENMVPVYRGGKSESAKVCIDVFEFPNKACELPFVWGSPQVAEQLCKSQGKRLCTQQEWTTACAADPAGGPDQLYAYGTKLDLAICNTSKPHGFGDVMAWGAKYWRCIVQSAESTWNTCDTDTEPSGAYPQCRSRFGVFDQHGNVAEMMTRKEGDKVFTQLKGSAFFYVDVAREHNAPFGSKKDDGGAAHDTYPDHCAYDPRWHVEELATAVHSNYHLGFRCCKSL